MKTLAERERERAQRNLHPTREAFLAMLVWDAECARQRGGSMDFWDRLSPSRKKEVRRWLKQLDKIGHAEQVAGAWSNDLGDDE